MNGFSRFLIGAVLLCGAFPAFDCRAQNAKASTAIALPPGQSLLPAGALEKVKLEKAPTEIIAIAGQSFARALRVRVPTTTGDSNLIQITVPNVAPVKKGDVLLATFAARGIAATGNAQVMLLFERNTDPWTKSVTRGVALPDATVWRRVAIPFVAQEDYAPDQAMTSLRLAFGAQTVDIADLQVRDYGSAVSLEQMRDVAAQMAPLGALDVTIDAAHKRQIMRGLGGNYTGGGREGWGTPNDSVAQYTRAHLHPVHARLGLSLKLWQPEANGAFVADGKTGEVLKMAGEFAAQKVPLTVSIWEAPDWMTAQQDGYKIIPETQWDAAINAIATFLERAQKERGASIENVSFNEPDYGVDIYWTPARIGAFIKRAVPEFARRGLKTKWLAGDTANGAHLVAFVRPQLEDAELRPLLGPVAFHGWDALSASDATYRKIADLAAQYNREVWCLEAGADAQAYKLTPSVWPTWNYALEVAQAYAKTLGPARSQLVDYWTYRDDFPLVDKENKPYPVFSVLQQFAQAFGPNTQIVESSAPSADIGVLAGVQADGTTVAMLINPVGAGQITLRGLKPNVAVAATLSEEKNQAIKLPQQMRTDSHGAITLALPARSMMVVTAK